MAKGDRVALCFFVDALGWEMAQEHGTFRKVAPHAYRQRTVLGYSCAAQPTILTGMMPSEHGHWGMFYRSGSSALAPLSRMRFLPTVVTSHRRFRRRLLLWHRRQSNFTGYYNFYRVPFELFSTFDIVEKKDIFAPAAFDPGVSSIFDHLVSEGVSFRSWSWKSGLDASLSELTDELREGQTRFFLLYTPHIDGFLHDKVDDDSAVARELAMVEDKITSVIDKAKETYSEVDVLIYSDHGMLKTTGTFDLMGFMRNVELTPGRDYTAFYDSTMARFWFSHDGARAEIVDALSTLDCGAILTDDDLESEGVHFEDRRFGELVFLMNPGVLVLPSHMGATAPKGMHGFTPEHPDSYAVIMSSSELTPAPEHIRDTFTAMKSMLE
jgi:predicted AlkP superfamily pyrophosphatase or phosphodiesterase